MTVPFFRINMLNLLKPLIYRGEPKFLYHQTLGKGKMAHVFSIEEERIVPSEIYGFLSIILSIVFIGLSWWTLQAVRFEKLLKKPNSAQAKLLQIFLSIVIGYELSRFFSDYLGWSLIIGNLFS